MEQRFTGTLIDKRNFNVFDELLVFLLADGALLRCIALGSRKIRSKNARNLIVGNTGEMEVFMARNPEKLSKLKKFVATHSPEPSVATSYAYGFVLEAVTAGGFEFNANTLVSDVERLVRIIGDDRALAYAIISVMKGLGNALVIDRCIVCRKREGLRLSLRAGGTKCAQHYDPPTDGVVSEQAASLIKAIVLFGHRPLITFNGEMAPVLTGLIEFFDYNSGLTSRTLASLRRLYRRVVKDQ